jgi:hypothetical protein
MVRLTPAQRAEIITLAKSGIRQTDIAKQYGISDALVSYHITKGNAAKPTPAPAPVETPTLSPHDKAWATRRANDNLAYYMTLTAGKKSAFTKLLKKGLNPMKPVAKVKVPKIPKTESKRKVRSFEHIEFNGTIKIATNVLMYLHLNPNGKEITFAKTKL